MLIGTAPQNTTSQAILEKYWISIALFILAAVSFASIYVGLFAAFVFTFIVPGLSFYRFFNLKDHEVWAFVPIVSILVSVEFIYCGIFSAWILTQYYSSLFSCTSCHLYSGCFQEGPRIPTKTGCYTSWVRSRKPASSSSLSFYSYRWVFC